jgi:hypothetical protein
MRRFENLQASDGGAALDRRRLLVTAGAGAIALGAVSLLNPRS